MAALYKYSYSFGRRTTMQVAVAEAAMGKRLRKGAVVHHVNYDRFDNRPSNLIVCTHAYHNLVHMRTDALNACGNANFRLCTGCRQYDDPKNMRLYTGEFSYRHVACSRLHGIRRGKIDENKPHGNGTMISFNGQVKNITEWGKLVGIPRSYISKRLRSGWSIERALTAPIRICKRVK